MRLLPTAWYQRCLICMDNLPPLKTFQPIAIFRLCVVFTGAYTVKVLCALDGFGQISVPYRSMWNLKIGYLSRFRETRQLFTKMLEFKTDEFSKKKNLTKYKPLKIATNPLGCLFTHKEVLCTPTLWIYLCRHSLPINAVTHYEFIQTNWVFVGKRHKWQLLETCQLFLNSSVLNSNFLVKSCLVSRNQDRWPIFKLHMEQYATHIFRIHQERKVLLRYMCP
jgi:hypothetical protein